MWERLQAEEIVPAKAQKLERTCRNDVVKVSYLRGLRGAGHRKAEGKEHGHGPRRVAVRSQTWAQGTEGKGAPSGDTEQEANACSFPASAGPALPQISSKMGGASPALFSTC